MVDIRDIADRREPSSVLLARPDYFRVVDVKNPYMSGSEVDEGKAMKQWKGLKSIYDQLHKEGLVSRVHVLPGIHDLEDIVFCANQSLPYYSGNGDLHVVMSNMRFDSRKREVPYFREYYEALGYKIETIPTKCLLEGMGDAIYHPFKKLLWMGHGYRTSLESAEHLEKLLGMQVIPLHLTSEYFYHLDTCFLPIDEHKVMICSEAFDRASFDRVAAVFSEVIEIDRREAIDTFCLNTHCLYNREEPVAVTPAGDHSVKRELTKSGYRVIEADTSEFIKAGGSVYCMKIMIY